VLDTNELLSAATQASKDLNFALLRDSRPMRRGASRQTSPSCPTYSSAAASLTYSPLNRLDVRLFRRKVYPAWILEPSATDLCEPDLHVFAKLFEDRLERGLEAQAFSGREIGGDDDVLDFFVGHLVDVDLARQPAA